MSEGGESITVIDMMNCLSNELPRQFISRREGRGGQEGVRGGDPLEIMVFSGFW